MTIEHEDTDKISLLQGKLASADAADAPEVAEELARLLGDDLDASDAHPKEDSSDEA